MARTLTLLVVGLLAVGTVVAFVSAQEPSSRRRSRYNTTDAMPAEPANLPPATAPGSLSERLRAAGEQMSQEFGSAAEPASASDMPAELVPAEAEVAPEISDIDPAARSVLKRPQPSLVDEATPPQLSPPQRSVGSPTVSRRGTTSIRTSG